jgi:hypothetical protein
MVASSFGKMVMADNPHDGLKEEDLAIALLMMITNNIGQARPLSPPPSTLTPSPGRLSQCKTPQLLTNLLCWEFPSPQ